MIGIRHANDEQLLWAYRVGSARAFEELVRRHGAKIKAYAYRILRSSDLAEDVYADVFERVARQRGKWEARGTVQSYLFTIAHHRCMDVLRRQKRERLGEGEVVTVEFERRTRPSPEASAALGQLASELEDAIAKLPEAHREVVLLRLVHGLSGEEAAAILGLDEGQVRSQLSYARKLLRQRLAATRQREGTAEAARAPEASDTVEGTWFWEEPQS